MKVEQIAESELGKKQNFIHPDKKTARVLRNSGHNWNENRSEITMIKK